MQRTYSHLTVITYITLVSDTAGEISLRDVSQGSEMGRARLGSRYVPMPC